MNTTIDETKELENDIAAEDLDRRVFSNMSADEMQIVALITQRMAQGQHIYGKLDATTDRRDWLTEATEEVIDSLVYSTAQLIRLRRAQQRKDSAE